MRSLIRPALSLFALLTVVTGVVYPLAVTGVAQTVFPKQAAGSLIIKNGHIIGSLLIGQHFSDPKYFWGRPSATSPMPYNAANSSGSNLAQTNPALIDAMKGRVEALKAVDPANNVPIPIDLVTASGSGLDPEISVAAADYQVARIARARGLAPDLVKALVERHAQGRDLGFLGEPRVNVLELNLALDQVGKS